MSPTSLTAVLASLRAAAPLQVRCAWWFARSARSPAHHRRRRRPGANDDASPDV